MKQADVLKKLEALKQSSKSLPIRYLKRANEFVNSTGSCDYNPESGTGHSYRWYELAKRIKGKQVLNTYSYSNQTAKHVWKLRNLFSLLGIKYVSVEAPRGLQSLELSARYHFEQVAEFELKNRYARKPGDYVGAIQYHREKIALLRSLGARFNSRDLLKMARNGAKQSREFRLSKGKRLRAEKRAKLLSAPVLVATAPQETVIISAVSVTQPVATGLYLVK